MSTHRVYYSEVCVCKDWDAYLLIWSAWCVNDLNKFMFVWPKWMFPKAQRVNTIYIYNTLSWFPLNKTKTTQIYNFLSVTKIHTFRNNTFSFYFKADDVQWLSPSAQKYVACLWIRCIIDFICSFIPSAVRCWIWLSIRINCVQSIPALLDYFLPSQKANIKVSLRIPCNL